LTHLISFNDKSPEMIPSFESAWPAAGLDERIQIAYFLGLNASEQAVNLLIRYINDADASKKAGSPDQTWTGSPRSCSRLRQGPRMPGSCRCSRR
jgi:hypothetical protein